MVKRGWLAWGVLWAVAGCGEDADADSTAAAPTVIRVTVENLAPAAGVDLGDGTYQVGFSPGVYLLTADGAGLFEAGASASAALQQLAEEGNPTALLESQPADRSGSLAMQDSVDYSETPLVSGGAFALSIEVNATQSLSLAMMFGASNDVFVGPAQGVLPLFDAEGNLLSGDRTAELSYWDAGTEPNEPPGHGMFQPSAMSGAGDDEGGVVTAFSQTDSAGHSYPPLTDVLRVSVLPAD